MSSKVHKSLGEAPEVPLLSVCSHALCWLHRRSLLPKSPFPVLFFPTLLQNLNQNPRTLLPKFYGLYCVQSGGKNIRVVVMNNILPRVVKMHLKFDLKGSTYKRRASKKEKEKSSPTYKDLDFIQDMPEGLMLDADTFSALVKTLQRDCLVRKRCSVRSG